MSPPDPGRGPEPAQPSVAPSRSAGLDGLRAVAILLVMLYHGSPSAFPGGMLGVDIFFVLSGYLITGLLVDEFGSTNNIWLGGFYGRRALRILPSLLAVVATVFVLAWLSQGGAPEAGVGAYLSPLTFLHNWVMVGQFPFLPDFGPTWSLAIEEQFYVLWPLLLLALLRQRIALRTITLVALLMALASFAWQVALSFSDTPLDRVYLGSDTRANGLLFGAAFGLWTRSRSFESWKPTLARFAPIGTVAFVLSLPLLVRLSDRDAAMHGLNLIFMVGAIAVIATAHFAPVSLPSRVLSWRPLVAIGVISYTLYLWHLTIWRFLQEQRDGTALAGPLILVIVLVAPIPICFLIHRTVEKPAMRRRYLFDWRRRAARQTGEAPAPGRPAVRDAS